MACVEQLCAGTYELDVLDATTVRYGDCVDDGSV